ncbi:MAG: cytochrome c oxidase assembly protein [Terriglobales bacterium]
MSEEQEATTRRQPGLHKQKWIWRLSIIAVAMVGFAFLQVPLFRVFCTHLGIYVPQDEKVAASTGPATGRQVTVSFSGVQADGMDIVFHPQNTMQTVHIGQRAENHFVFVNNTNHTVYFRAIHDIYPYQAATHLALIQCFCFTNQVMKPHTKKSLPVIYQVNRGLDSLVKRVSIMYTLESIAPHAPEQSPSPIKQMLSGGNQ